MWPAAGSSRARARDAWSLATVPPHRPRRQAHGSGPPIDIEHLRPGGSVIRKAEAITASDRRRNLPDDRQVSRPASGTAGRVGGRERYIKAGRPFALYDPALARRARWRAHPARSPWTSDVESGDRHRRNGPPPSVCVARHVARRAAPDIDTSTSLSARRASRSRRADERTPGEGAGRATMRQIGTAARGTTRAGIPTPRRAASGRTTPRP